MRTQTNSLEQLEARYDQVLSNLDELLSKIDSTILVNKPVVPNEPPVGTHAVDTSITSDNVRFRVAEMV